MDPKLQQAKLDAHKILLLKNAQRSPDQEEILQNLLQLPQYNPGSPINIKNASHDPHLNTVTYPDHKDVEDKLSPGGILSPSMPINDTKHELTTITHVDQSGIQPHRIQKHVEEKSPNVLQFLHELFVPSKHEKHPSDNLEFSLEKLQSAHETMSDSDTEIEKLSREDAGKRLAQLMTPGGHFKTPIIHSEATSPTIFSKRHGLYCRLFGNHSHFGHAHKSPKDNTTPSKQTNAGLPAGFACTPPSASPPATAVLPHAPSYELNITGAALESISRQMEHQQKSITDALLQNLSIVLNELIHQGYFVTSSSKYEYIVSDEILLNTYKPVFVSIPKDKVVVVKGPSPPKTDLVDSKAHSQGHLSAGAVSDSEHSNVSTPISGDVGTPSRHHRGVLSPLRHFLIGWKHHNDENEHLGLKALPTNQHQVIAKKKSSKAGSRYKAFALTDEDPSLPVVSNINPQRLYAMENEQKAVSNSEKDISSLANSNNTMAKNLLEKYGLLDKKRKLGTGRSGVVRLARKQSGEEAYAVKQFRRRKANETEKEYNKKITGEYCIAYSLQHPNIVRTYDMIHEKNRWLEVMEFCEGGDLLTIINDGIMSREEIDCCFRQLLNGLGYMHANGVAHRDIKPENLLMDRHGCLKITDFGVSDVFQRVGLESTNHHCKGVYGSVPYMAPEIFTRDEYDGTKVDIWSAAITYYTFNFGAIPWRLALVEDENYRYFLEGHQNLDFLPFIKLPKGALDVMKKMMKVPPEKRASIQSLLDDDRYINSIDICKDCVTSNGVRHKHYYTKEERHSQRMM